MHDVKCNDCHNVHSGKLLFEDNKLCTQCHIAENYDVPTHTHHKDFGENGESLISVAGVKFDVGSGTLCINCHMHGQNFMGVDYRRDHSFRIPRPDLSEKLGTPNACNQCHKDKSNQWAQSNIEKWFGESRPFQYGEVFDKAASMDPSADVRLTKMIHDDLFSPPIRAIAMSMLVADDISNNKTISNGLQSTEAAIRIAAIQRLNINSRENLDKLATLLNDDLKAVRLAAFQRIIDIDTNLLTPKQRLAFKNVEQENYKALLYNSDFPVGKYNLANYYQIVKQYEKAEKLYLAAIEQDAELSAAKMNLANLYSKMGRPKDAESLLQQYVQENPNDGSGYYNYGLILSENRKYMQSLSTLIKAGKLMPDNERIDYNIAMLYEFFKDYENAELYLKKRIEKRPNLLDAYITLLEFYIRINEREKVMQFSTQIVNRFPDKQSIDRVKRAISSH
jgi:tetratricopeptide (TPR) repeat protein